MKPFDQAHNTQHTHTPHHTAPTPGIFHDGFGGKSQLNFPPFVSAFFAHFVCGTGNANKMNLFCAKSEAKPWKAAENQQL